MGEPRWLPRIVLDAVHLDQLREHGGLHGIRERKALESALARSHQRWTRKPISDLATMAAAYAFGIARAHPFNDGNKRAAFLAAMIFLGLNGQDLDATETEVVQAVTALAAGSLSEADLATFIRERIVPLVL